jgi:hypothetical protein
LSEHNFDFLVGEWRVRHRRLRPDTGQWAEFDGTASSRTLMDGAASVEEHALDAPEGVYRAVALRARDPQTGRWASWWLDGRHASGPLDPPVVGGLDATRWDRDATWTMEYTRAESGPAAPARDGPSDFDFLHGDWDVRHRFLGANGGWRETDGTASCTPLMGGRANVEEHTIEAPSGPYRAVALRSYDLATRAWSIWWLDGRAPHDPLDPPMRGTMGDGVGAFYGYQMVGDQRMLAMYRWSDITRTSARWRQGYAADRHSPFTTNWVMQFRR